MAACDEQSVLDMNNLLDDLREGTAAHLVSDTSRGVLHDRRKVLTPIPQLNCFFGGGVPLSIIVELFGDPACFTGDTKVIIPGSQPTTLSELYFNGHVNIPIQNCDNTNASTMGRVHNDVAKSICLSKYTKELVYVYFDDDTELIKCTPDHPFLLVNGSYKPASELIPDDEIMTNDIDNYVCIVSRVQQVELDDFVPVFGLRDAGKFHNYAIELPNNRYGIFVSNSGKTSVAYQMMGSFQCEMERNHEPYVCIVIDTEASVDSSRMPFMGVDPSKVLRIPSTTIEWGFAQLFKILDKKVKNPKTKDIPVCVIWDTIGANPSAKEMESDNQFCFTGDTPVKLLDGRNLTLAEIMQEFKTKSGEKGETDESYVLSDSNTPDLWVYSYDPVEQKVRPGQITAVGITGRTKELYEVVLDDGFKLRCTGNHRFMKRSGEYIEAKDMQPGESLMAMYWRTHNNGHEVITYSEHVGTHRMVGRYLHGEELGELHVHHVDMIQSNNRPSNLKVMTNSEHTRLHNTTNRHDAWMKRLDKMNANGLAKYAVSCRTDESYIEQAKLHYLRKAREVLDLGLDPTWENLYSRYHAHHGLQEIKRRINQYWATIGDLFAEARTYVLNHKVVSVTRVNYDEPIELYDIEVGLLHNFCIPTNKGGLFVSNSEGMMGHAKLLKFELSKLLPRIEDQPMLVLLLNQVITEKGMYTSRLGSGGGFGIKHNAHVRIQFFGGQSDRDDIFVIRKNSELDIVKSKISPLFDNMSFVLDVTEGGAVDPIYTMAMFARNTLEYITKDARCRVLRPYEMHPEFDGKFEPFTSTSKSQYFKTFIDYANKRPKILKLFQICFIDEICSRYKYQEVICKPYRDRLIREMDDPEPMDDGKGNVVDEWTGSIIDTYNPDTQYVEIHVDKILFNRTYEIHDKPTRDESTETSTETADSTESIPAKSGEGDGSTLPSGS